QLGAGNTLNQVGTQNLSALTNIATNSYISAVHYDYKSKYLIDLTGRYDGSSAFAPSSRSGFFPAATAAYRIFEEPFLRYNPALSFLDDLKIRVSYGMMGDAAGTNGYNFLAGYNYPATGNAQTLPGGSVFDGNYVNGVAFRGLTNPNITWYKINSMNIGLDGDLWKGLLGFQFDYFDRNRSGLLATRLLSLPGSVGATLPQENLNSDETKGFELVVTHASHIGKLGYRVSGNFSFTRTQWKHFEQAPQGNSYADWIANLNGRYNGIWFGYGGVGQFGSFGQIQTYPVNQGGGNRSSVPGDYIYEDYNHDGYIDAGDLHPIAGTYGGNATSSTSSPPWINFGLTLAADYMGFDLNILLQGAADKWISYPIDLAYPLDHGGNAYAQFLNRWHPVDPTADPFNPNTVYTGGYYPYTGTQVNQSSTFGVQNASYVRVKSLEVGYTLPAGLTKKAGISRCRIYANGFNVLTFSGLRGADPEHPSDLYGQEYPNNKTYNAGVNISF
ncbi:MAG: TonB-dependent receptor, partial [Bacteroidetes bacterium]|nr:TonB-dependent receptor [Bacteroidota bacterium]